MDLDLAAPDTYRWFTEEHVRFSDTDLVGHVNNVSHVALVETGRIRYVSEVLGRVGVSFGTIMFVRLEIDFRDHLHWPAAVRVGARMLSLGTSSFRVGVGVFDGDRCVTTSVNVLVHLGEDQRASRLPDAVREVMAAEVAA